MESAALQQVADFSLWSLFLRADFLIKLVMLGLLGASIWCWAIIFEKLFTLKRVRANSDAFETMFWSGENLQKLYRDMAKAAPTAPNPMSAIFTAGMREYGRTNKVRTLPTGITQLQLIERVLTNAVAREMEKLEHRLLFLATVGAVAPFIGLFGTVWGIMNSFRAIAVTRDTNLAVVAPGIAEALFATGLGLLAAIPAVIAYNKFSNDLSRLGARLDYFADDFINIIAQQTPASTSGSTSSTSRQSSRSKKSSG